MRRKPTPELIRAVIAAQPYNTFTLFRTAFSMHAIDCTANHTSSGDRTNESWCAQARWYAEALRSIFVEHTSGKRALFVDMTDHSSDWQLFMRRIVVEITRNSKVDMAAAFVPPFSSSTLFDTSMKSLAVMDHMQTYFSCSSVYSIPVVCAAQGCAELSTTGGCCARMCRGCAHSRYPATRSTRISHQTVHMHPGWMMWQASLTISSRRIVENLTCRGGTA